MSAGRAFFDTSVLLYLFSADTNKANRIEKLLATGGVISVQVLSEFTAVARRKLSMSWDEIAEALGAIREVCRIETLTEATHDLAFELAAKYGLSWYDAMIIASARLAQCDTVYTEDMHSGLLVEGRLKLVNPFS